MKRSKKISAIMHKLLIERRIDNFSVVELRDASLSIEGMDSDLDEARKKVYRQILRFEKINWLRSEGSGQKKRYFQTDLFKKQLLEPKLDSVEISIPSTPDYSVLSKERKEYKAELEIILGEIEEYQSLKIRFPELEPKLTPLQQQAKERSALLLGKMNVLTNVLRTIYRDSSQC
ncbi:hypothetical protein GNP61_06410 [Aliivibrio fischeri]|uniref:hypothetical protein n=1 Tax=Aliivibrio fischeri TaxID=668 RepID=UPI0012DA6A4B|nr:hypothetical protein [Aliivibrio fischeri]MUK41189.1 hypothetical protein [Aliivibrio fischeri]